MTICRACSSEIPGPDRYCRNCGAPVAPSVAEWDDTRRFNASGPTGPSGLSGSQTSVNGLTVDCATTTCSPAGPPLTAEAACPAGTFLLGGGAEVTNSDTGLVSPNVVLVRSISLPLSGWSRHVTGSTVPGGLTCRTHWR